MDCQVCQPTLPCFPISSNIIWPYWLGLIRIVVLLWSITLGKADAICVLSHRTETSLHLENKQATPVSSDSLTRCFWTTTSVIDLGMVAAGVHNIWRGASFPLLKGMSFCLGWERNWCSKREQCGNAENPTYDWKMGNQCCHVCSSLSHSPFYVGRYNPQPSISFRYLFRHMDCAC